MKKRILFSVFGLALALGLIASIINVGCDSKNQSNGEKPPVFVLGWSEYQSSSVFGVAHEQGLINGEEGKLGTLEKKWGIDIVLKQTDYDSLITLYGTDKADAVCITNMDTLATSLGRKGVAIIPVSTSKGGDAVVVTPNVKTVDDLKKVSAKGLEKSVSQYMYQRNLELLGKNPAEFQYSNMDPAAAAQAMQTKQSGIDAVVIWNPFITQTIKTRPECKVIFDSSTIPNEIVDVVWAGSNSLQKPGGDKFAALVCDIFYTISAKVKAGDKDTIVALGAKFSNLNYDEMRYVLTQTIFYGTPDEGLALLASTDFQKTITPRVTDWAVAHDMTKTKPVVGFDDEKADVNFSSKYIKMVK
jgi:ABC-type nitrate/sulfonate/bicarbonate transport system substrate-binding protein